MTRSDKGTPPTTGMGAGGCLVRLGWMLFGSAILLFSAIGIIRHEGFLSIADGAFWAALAACIALRYVDVKYLHGHTAAGEPATMAHWRRYVLTMLGLGAAVWGIAHGISCFYA
jgi:hypothetical protein